MRVGNNPVKKTYAKLVHKPHRVIMPIYIPNLEEEYFINAFEVVQKSIESILCTIDNNFTNITIINNGSCQQVDTLLMQYFDEEKIDRYVKQNNRGKVEAVTKEAKASYEEYITITDADVFFRKGWLENTLKIFKVFKNAGMVSPLPTPNIYAAYNNIAVVQSFYSGRIEKNSVVSQEDLHEFEKSIDSIGLFNKYYNSQFFLENDGYKTLLGASHMTATYKGYLFKDENKKVEYIFENGLEKDFLDVIAQKHGLWRLGCTKSYVHHMGNSVYDEDLNIKKVELTMSDFPIYKIEKKLSVYKSFIYENLARFTIYLLNKKVVKVNK